jgi:hypothetical protein
MWSYDLRRTAGGSWMRVAEHRARWRDIGEAYVQHWTVVGWWWWWPTLGMFTYTCERAFLVSSGFAHARGIDRMRSTLKEYFICVFIVKRDKCMRDAGRCASACVSVPTTACQVPILETGRMNRILLTIVNTLPQPVENWNLKLRIIRSVKFHACELIPRACANRMTIKLKSEYNTNCIQKTTGRMKVPKRENFALPLIL